VHDQHHAVMGAGGSALDLPVIICGHNARMVEGASALLSLGIAVLHTFLHLNAARYNWKTGKPLKALGVLVGAQCALAALG
jgi:uncharacterized membrane protein YfcA